MATPPFLPDETKPGASDLISLFPSVEQTFRDVMETWMLVGHNTTGEHTAITVNSGGGTNAIIDEGNLDRSSGSAETFNFKNSGAGTMTLKVDTVVVPTISSTSTLTNKTLNAAVLGAPEIVDKIVHNGDTNNRIVFGTDTQTFETNASTKMDIGVNGFRLGGANSYVTAILDEDAMGSDASNALATQQSIKAYVDNKTITRGTAQATTSGTTKTFGSLKAGANRITIVFDSVSLSGTDNILIQIGDAGGIEASVYVSKASDTAAEGPSHKVTSTSGFIIYNGSGAGAGNKVSGRMTLLRVTSNVWVSDHVLHGTAEDVNSGGVLSGAGRKSLSAELTQVRLTRTGSNSFDNGQINVFVE